MTQVSVMAPGPLVEKWGYIFYIGYIICPANSSHSFWVKSLLFCWMLVWILKICMCQGLWFSCIFEKITGHDYATFIKKSSSFQQIWNMCWSYVMQTNNKLIDFKQGWLKAIIKRSRWLRTYTLFMKMKDSTIFQNLLISRTKILQGHLERLRSNSTCPIT
jgi:hypothetical protein